MISSPTSQPGLAVDLPKESDPGEFVLVVARPGGGILGQHVFFVDTLVHHGVGEASFIQGHRGNALEVEFPAFTPYVLINRRQTSFMEGESPTVSNDVGQLEDLVVSAGGQHTHPGTSEPVPGQYL